VDILEDNWLDMIEEETSRPQNDCLLVKAGNISPSGLTRQHSLELSPPSKRKKSSLDSESAPVVPMVFPPSKLTEPLRQQASSLSTPNNTKTDTTQMSPDELAMAIAAKASAELRSNGLAFMEQESSTIHTLEEFRKAFNGANGPTFDSDNEVGVDQSNEVDNSKKKRLRPVNPDAELIERATEEQVRILNIDCRGTEGKKQRRRIRNRMSAQLHRERKKLYIDALEAFVKIKEGRIAALERDVMHLAKENERLRSGSQVMPSLCVVSSASGSDRGSKVGSNVDANMHASGNSTDGTDESDSELVNSPLYPSSREGDVGAGNTIAMEKDSFASTIEGMSDDERRILGSLLPKEEDIASETHEQHTTRGSYSTGVRVSGAMAPLFPLLSVICLLCITMYGSGVGQISNTGAGSGTDISIHRRLSAAEEEQKTLAIVSVAALKEEHTNLAKQWQKETQARHHEADLLALPAPLSSRSPADSTATASSYAGAALDLYGLLYGNYPDVPYEHIRSSLEKGLILWKRDRLLSRIYPRYSDNMTGVGDAGVDVPNAGNGVNADDRNVTVTSRRTKEGNLRSRSISSSITRPSATAASPAPRPSETNALIPSATVVDRVEELTSSQPRSVSRVLLNQGLVLLDPDLASPLVASAQAKETFSSFGGEATSLSTTLDIHSQQTHHDQAQSQAKAHTADTPGTGPIGMEENVVMIAVPASSVRWGRSWASSVPNSLYNASASSLGEKGPFDGDDAYIELGCSVFKAQVVSSVHTHDHTSRYNK